MCVGALGPARSRVSAAVLVDEFGEHVLQLRARHVEHRVSSAGGQGAGRRAAVPPPPTGGGGVGGAALGRAAPLNEGGAAPVGVVLGLQGGRGEDVGGQAPQLIGPRLGAVLVRLQTDQSQRGEGG